MDLQQSIRGEKKDTLKGEGGLFQRGEQHGTPLFPSTIEDLREVSRESCSGTAFQLLTDNRIASDFYQYLSK